MTEELLRMQQQQQRRRRINRAQHLMAGEWREYCSLFVSALLFLQSPGMQEGRGTLRINECIRVEERA